MIFSPSFRRTMLVFCGLGLVAGSPARAQFFFPFFDNRPSRPPNAEMRRHPPHEIFRRESERSAARNKLHRPKLKEAERRLKSSNKATALAKAEAPAPAIVEGPPPPYEPQLLRLSELMGALSYLRDLCQAGDGAEFREKMARLLDAETHSETRKDTLAGAFNRGFDDYALTYRACTPSAREVISHYLDESGRIARDIASRSGG